MIVFGIAGWSGSGKTTLIEKLIPQFTARGLSVSVIKHAHHGFDLDRPGKDSFRHREAGAQQVLMLSAQRWVLMHELRDEEEPSLQRQLEMLGPCDIVLIEGFKAAAVPKVEVFRAINGKPQLWPENSYVVAVATDDPITCDPTCLPLSDPERIANFILSYQGTQ